MQVDNSIQCGTNRHTSIVAYATIMIVVCKSWVQFRCGSVARVRCEGPLYKKSVGRCLNVHARAPIAPPHATPPHHNRLSTVPVGTPIFIFLLLWSRAKDIRERTSREGGESLASISFLFQSYARKHWWMGVVDMIRRLSLGCILLFMEAATQIAVAFVITVVFTVACREKR